ncbi:MAG: DUF1501 domain-containing protein [Pseudomonadota bacterium]
MTTRRDFLRNAAYVTAASMIGAAGAPKFTFAQEAGGKTFVKVFMRGGADGLHTFPKVGDINYYNHRPNIAIEAPNSGDTETSVSLGNGLARAMNPNLEPLLEIWDAGRMMVAPACGITEGNRSHFDCQRWIGNGARSNIIDGYLNRLLQETGGETGQLRGAVLGKGSVSTELSGQIAVPAINNPGNFEIENNDFCMGSGCADNQLTELMMQVVSNSPTDMSDVEARVRATQLVTLDTISGVMGATQNYVTDAGGLEYSGSSLGKGLKMVAQFLKGGIPLEVAAMDFNVGWDSHSNQIADGAQRFTDQTKGYHRNIRQGALDFVTFYRDIGPLLDNVVVLVCTEFGRTVKENGSQGTDHGHASGWFAFGGPTSPVMAEDVTTLAEENLDRGRYLPNVVDYRNVVGEIMVRHMGLSENLVSTVFPGHGFTNLNLFTQTS